jgi:hypothetical protein
LFEPKLVRPAQIEANGLLRLSGYFETSPEQVNFDMAFQFIGGQWRLFGLALETRAPATAAAGAPVSEAATETAKAPGAPAPASKQAETSPAAQAKGTAAIAPSQPPLPRQKSVQR